MCLILIAKDVHPTYPLIIIANREEHHSRPTQSLSFWHDYPTIAAGRDLTAGGTWFGLNLQGLFAAVTNFHEPTVTVKSEYSRGMLVADWLRRNTDSADCHLQKPGQLQRYPGVNVISGNITTLWWDSNRGSAPRRIPSGISGLSNDLLDSPWHKIVYGKQLFKTILSHSFRSDTFFELLSDCTPASEIELNGVMAQMRQSWAKTTLILSCSPSREYSDIVVSDFYLIPAYATDLGFG